MSRTATREDAFKLIFEAEINKTTDADSILSYYYSLACEEVDEDGSAWAIKEYDGEDKNYLSSVFLGVINNKEEIDDKISQALTNWSNDRISKVCLAVMRLAVYEMVYINEIPIGVSINEAVELAKKYGGSEDSSFVNGVLATVSKGVSAK